MNVLILFEFDIHDQTIDALCNNLRKQDVSADSLNVITWKFRNYSKNRKPYLISVVEAFMKIPKVRGFIILKFRTKILSFLSAKYDIIDIHFFSPLYDDVIKNLKKRGNAVKITIWGSDFYRVDKERREKQRKIYPLVNAIQIETRQIGEDFLAVYPEFYEKIRYAHFGIRQFEIIDDLSMDRDVAVYKTEMQLPGDKIILVCGFNGSSGHQHSVIFEAIEKLPAEIKAQIFLLIPLTYGATQPYIETVRLKAESLHMPYKLISSSMTLPEVCKLRLASDIAITIQKTDALSAAIQEQLYAGGMLIAGDWLPYQILSENGIFFIQTSLASLTEVISQSIANLATLKLHSPENKTRTAALSSWNTAIKDWLAIYNEINISGNG